jgi:hypothetical protein
MIKGFTVQNIKDEEITPSSIVVILGEELQEEENISLLIATLNAASKSYILRDIEKLKSRDGRIFQSNYRGIVFEGGDVFIEIDDPAPSAGRYLLSNELFYTFTLEYLKRFLEFAKNNLELDFLREVYYKDLSKNENVTGSEWLSSLGKAVEGLD